MHRTIHARRPDRAGLALALAAGGARRAVPTRRRPARPRPGEPKVIEVTPTPRCRQPRRRTTPGAPVDPGPYRSSSPTAPASP